MTEVTTGDNIEPFRSSVHQHLVPENCEEQEETLIEEEEAKQPMLVLKKVPR